MHRRLTKKDLKAIDEAVESGVIVQEDPEVSAWVTRMELIADAEVLGGVVAVPWDKPQMDVVARAAAILGVSKESYIKQAAFTRALEDIARAEAVLGEGEVAQLEGRKKPLRRK